MYLGKTLFAQAMDFLPWKTFHRIVKIDTAATTGRVAAVAPSSFASWPSRS